MGFRTDVDDFHVHGREVYWLCRSRSSKQISTRRSSSVAIAGPATWRNMNTIVRLAKKYSH